jgi:hypothetical protein
MVTDGKLGPLLKTGSRADHELKIIVKIIWLPPRDSNPDNLLQRQVS